MIHTTCYLQRRTLTAATKGHFIGVSVNNWELLISFSSVVKVDTNTTRNNVVVVGLKDISRIIATVRAESIVVARLDLAAEWHLVQTQVTVTSSGATQVTALAPERVGQVHTGLISQVRHREDAARSAVGVGIVGNSTAATRWASRNVSASREGVAFTASTLQQ